MEITINLPQPILERLLSWSSATKEDVAQTVARSLTVTLPPVQTEPAVESLSDADVLSLSTVKMDVEQDKRLVELLVRQREGQILPDEQPELIKLMQIHNQLWLRQSQALVEAVKRGLRPPLSS